MYHFVMNVPDIFPSLKTLSLDSFIKQLDFLKANYYPLRLSNLRRVLNDKTEYMPDNGFLLTFDHGTRDHIDNVLPELLKRDLQGCFYIMSSVPENRILPSVDKQRFLEGYFHDYREFFTQFTQKCIEYDPLLRKNIEATKENIAAARDFLCQFPFYSDYERLFRKIRSVYISDHIYDAINHELFSTFIGDEVSFVDKHYLKWEDIAVLKSSGMEIGSHGHNHIVYSKSNLSSCSQDLKVSFSLLRKRLNCHEIDSIAYPNGGYNRELESLLAEIDVKLAFTTVQDMFFSATNRYRVGRIDTKQIELRYQSQK